MEAGYYFNPDIRPKIRIPFGLNGFEGEKLDAFIIDYYHIFRAQEVFDKNPHVDLDKMYERFVQDWNDYGHRTTSSRVLGPVVWNGFLRRLSGIDQFYMEECHRDVIQREQREKEARDSWNNYGLSHIKDEPFVNPVMYLEKPHSNEHDSGDNIPEPGEFELYNAASYRERINAWKRREELRRR
jgi:hypothetical protein